jgi:flagellin
VSFSVHSMAGVNSALRYLGEVSRDTAAVENRIATGLKVGSAKDNGTIWALAQGMRASNEGRNASLRSIDMATGVVEVALAAAEGISDLMGEMKSKLVAATDTSLDETSWRALMNDYVVFANEIKILVDNADFGGQNLLKSGATDLSVLVGDDASDTMTIAAEDFTDGAGILDVALPGTLPHSFSDIVSRPDQAMVTTFESSMNDINSAMARLGVGLKSLTIQKTLLTKQMDVTEAGIGSLVDADLGRENAKLQALRVQQQLGMEALSVANRAPQMILGFFR